MKVNYIFDKETNCFTWELVSKEDKVFALIKIFQKEKFLEVLDLKFFDEIQKDEAKRIFINLLKEHARHSLIKETKISENIDLENIEIKKQNVNLEDIKIIPETDNYKHQAEVVCKKSFYNKFVPGCNEHLFLHKIYIHFCYHGYLSQFLQFHSKLCQKKVRKQADFRYCYH